MTLEFNYSFGFRHSNRSVAFYKNDTVMFGAGKLCILFDLDSKIQTCFEFIDHNEVSAFVRCGVFLAAALRGRRPSVCQFNTLSETKKFYSAPDSMESEEFTCLSVSVNLKFIAAQGASPDWLLVIWLSQTREIAVILCPAVLSGASVYDISFHAGGRDELVVVGNNVFKLFDYQDETGEEKALFKEIVFEKFEKSQAYHTIGWPEKENLVVGSSKGRLLFFRGIDMVLEVNLKDDLKQHGLQVDSFDIDESGKAVTSIAIIPQQLLCAFAGFVVLIYEGDEISSYTLTKFIFLSPDKQTQSVPGEVRGESDHLLSIIVNLSGKDLVATTRDGQMLHCSNFAEGSKHQYFVTLLPKSHNDPVIRIDVSKGKPLVASCSRYTLILSNYFDKSLEIRKLFKNEINSVALHPTGLFVALAFDHFCRIFSILHHDLKERKLLVCRNCSNIGFSVGGHLLTVVSNSIIKIYSFISFELLFKLDGHAGLVTAFDWLNHDAKLISCDNRGVICEWDLVSETKLWEKTAAFSYLSVSANRCIGSVVAASSDHCVRSFKNGLLEWTVKCKKELISVLSYRTGEIFYVGTSDGCIELRKYLRPNESVSVNAHSGRVSDLKYAFDSDFVVSSGSDGCIFLWKTSRNDESLYEGIYSKLSLVDKLDLINQEEKSKQLHLSLQHIDTANDCEFELNCIKHEELIREMSLNHAHYVEELNDKIIIVKEEMQNLLFDSDFQKDGIELDLIIKQEVIDRTFKLNEAYKESNSYADETNKIVLDYEKIINKLTANHAKYSCNQSNEIESIREEIKTIENTLLLEKEMAKQTHLLDEEYKNKVEQEVNGGEVTFKDSQKSLLEKVKSKSSQLNDEVEKLKRLTELIIKDTVNRKSEIVGKIDYDIKENISAITILKDEFKKLEDLLEMKEKNCQIQEMKFCELRNLVGSSRKYYSVSRTSIDELLQEMNIKELQIQSCVDSIKKLSICIPQLEDEIRVADDLCSTVTKKLKESVDGYQKKEKMLRDTQDTIKKYTNMLHQCIKKDCDPIKLRDNILSLFEENKVGFEDETVDAQLLNEYEFQIKKLKSTYDLIKGEPTKSMQYKSIAEFRLSQENSKILQDVHEIQKESEKQRLIINDLETALGLQAALAKSTKFADELRRKIEFVIKAKKNNRKERMHQIAQLDLFIQEQQREIERFQTILSAKVKKKHKKM